MSPRSLSVGVAAILVLTSVVGCTGRDDALNKDISVSGWAVLKDHVYFVLGSQGYTVSVDVESLNPKRVYSTGQTPADIIPFPDGSKALIINTDTRTLDVIDDRTGDLAFTIEGLEQNFTSYTFSDDSQYLLMLLVDNWRSFWNRDLLVVDRLTALVAKFGEGTDVELHPFRLHDRGDVPIGAVISPEFAISDPDTELDPTQADKMRFAVVLGKTTLWVFDPENPADTQTSFKLPGSSQERHVFFCANCNDGETVDDTEYIFVHTNDDPDLIVISAKRTEDGFLYSINQVAIGNSSDVLVFGDENGRLMALSLNCSKYSYTCVLGLTDLVSSEQTSIRSIANVPSQADLFGRRIIPVETPKPEHAVIPTENGLLLISLKRLFVRGERNIQEVNEVVGEPRFVVRSDTGEPILFYVQSNGSFVSFMSVYPARMIAEASGIYTFSSADNVCVFSVSPKGDKIAFITTDSETSCFYGNKPYPRKLVVVNADGTNANSLTVSMNSHGTVGPLFLESRNGTLYTVLFDLDDPAGYIVVFNPETAQGEALDAFLLEGLF